MTVRDFVIASFDTFGPGANIQIRDLRTNAYVATHTFTGSGVGSGNGYLVTKQFAVNPHDPVFIGTNQSIAVVDLTSGTLLDVLPHSPPYGSLIGGAAIEDTSGPFVHRVHQVDIPSAVSHRTAQTIDVTTGAPFAVSPSAPGDITAVGPLGLAGSIDVTNGILAGIDTYFYVWNNSTNTWNVGTTVPCVSGSIRAVQYGDQLACICQDPITHQDIIFGTANEINATTSPAIIQAGGLCGTSTGGIAQNGRFTYATGTDGTTIWLYVIDNVMHTIGTVAALPSTYGIPDSLCCSFDGTVIYCLCSAAAVGYPVTVATGSIGTIASWGVVAPGRATLWPVTENAAPWVLGHVEVAPAPSPWLVGLVP